MLARKNAETKADPEHDAGVAAAPDRLAAGQAADYDWQSV
jgi:hypothetical protein